MVDPTTVKPGDTLVDNESGKTVIALSAPGTTAGTHVIHEMPPGESHWTLSDSYDVPDDAPVIEVFYLDSANQKLSDWTIEEILDNYTPGGAESASSLNIPGLKAYAFNANRLEHADE